MTGPAPEIIATPTPRYGPARLYRDAASLATSSVVNAGLGAVFWAIAGFMIAPERLGVMTAVLAVITSASIIVATGVGDTYTSLMPSAGALRPQLIARGQRAFLAMASVGGAVASILAVTLLDETRGSLAVVVLIFAGTFIWGAYTLQISTLAGMGKANWLPLASSAASGAKLLVLPVVFLSIGWHAVELATLVPALLVVIVVNRLLRRSLQHGSPPISTPGQSEELARDFNRIVKQATASIALTLGLLTAAPFLVTVFAGPAEGALFALALSIVQTLDFLGAAMGVSLVVHAAGEPGQARTMAKSILLRALALSATGGIVLSFLAPFIIGTLNEAYRDMNVALTVVTLCVGSVIRTAYMVWAALQRAARRFTPILILNGICCVVSLCSIPLLTAHLGAAGGALAVLIGQIVLTTGAVVHWVRTREASR
ncbi:MAG: hypothetical protein LLG14_25920 [Nocardiaceae bacterium]|nr:hypothetical protein [Nocardiaceae bacterium]